MNKNLTNCPCATKMNINTKDKVYCEKFECFIEDCSFCEDTEEINTNINRKMSEKEKSRRRRHNDRKHKEKLKWQSKNIGGYPSPAYPVGKDGHYASDEDEVLYYKKISKSSHASRYKYFKKLSNKIVRRHFNYGVTKEYFETEEPERDVDKYIDSDPSLDLGTGKGTYKKIFDYWWTVD